MQSDARTHALRLRRSEHHCACRALPGRRGVAAMLMPKKVKHRKQHRGRMTGNATGGTRVTFGEYGIQALEPGWITARQIEAARIAMTRHVRRGGKERAIQKLPIKARFVTRASMEEV